MITARHIEDFLFWLVTGAVGATAAGTWWLIRRVFTNQQQIELLTREIAHRDKLRSEDREDMREVKDSVKRIETKLMGGK